MRNDSRSGENRTVVCLLKAASVHWCRAARLNLTGGCEQCFGGSGDCVQSPVMIMIGSDRSWLINRQARLTQIVECPRRYRVAAWATPVIPMTPFLTPALPGYGCSRVHFASRFEYWSAIDRICRIDDLLAKEMPLIPIDNCQRTGQIRASSSHFLDRNQTVSQHPSFRKRPLFHCGFIDQIHPFPEKQDRQTAGEERVDSYILHLALPRLTANLEGS